MSGARKVLCFYCGRRFANHQSRKAHLRYCDPYHVSKQPPPQPEKVPQALPLPQAVTVPQAVPAEVIEGTGDPPARTLRPTTTVRAPVRRAARPQELRLRTQHQRRLVIDIHDRLRTVQDVCLNHTRFALSCDGMFGQGETWKRLLMQIHDLVEGTATLLYGLSPTPTPLFLYESLRQIHVHWRAARFTITMSPGGAAYPCPEQENEEVDVATQEELRAIEHVIAQVKELVAITT